MPGGFKLNRRLLSRRALCLAGSSVRRPSGAQELLLEGRRVVVDGSNHVRIVDGGEEGKAISAIQVSAAAWVFRLFGFFLPEAYKTSKTLKREPQTVHALPASPRPATLLQRL
jgi:hypothetical protein